jgi:hypothetical protein
MSLFSYIDIGLSVLWKKAVDISKCDEVAGYYK